MSDIKISGRRRTPMKILEIFVVVYLGFAGVILPIKVLVDYMIQTNFDYIEKERNFYKEKFEYFSNGVIERDLVTICASKAKVTFKEDCPDEG